MSRHLAMYLASLVIFGTNGVVASMTFMGSADIVLSRIALGLALLAAVFAVRRLVLPRPVRWPRRDALFLLASGAAMGGGWVCLFEAYTRIGVGVSTLLYYCGPIAVMALSSFLFKERIDARKALCFAAVVFGSCLVGGFSYASGMDPVGLLLGAGAAVSYALMVVFGKVAAGVGGVDRALVQLAGALAAVLAVRMAMGEPLLPAVSPQGLPWILVLGLVNTGLACYLYFAPLAKLECQTVAVCGYLEPLSAAVFASVILGETLDPVQVLGGAFIVGGAVLFDIVKPLPRTAPAGSLRRCR